jgi:hypothetical protein
MGRESGIAALEGKLLKHGLPDLLVLDALTGIGYAPIDHFEDATEQTLEDH